MKDGGSIDMAALNRKPVRMVARLGSGDSVLVWRWDRDRLAVLPGGGFTCPLPVSRDGAVTYFPTGAALRIGGRDDGHIDLDLGVVNDPDALLALRQLEVEPEQRPLPGQLGHEDSVPGPHLEHLPWRQRALQIVQRVAQFLERRLGDRLDGKGAVGGSLQPGGRDLDVQVGQRHAGEVPSRTIAVNGKRRPA